VVCLFADGIQQRIGSVIGGHHDDARRRRQLVQTRQHFDAIHARHPDIEQHQIEGLDFQRLQAFQAIAGLFHHVTGLG
jgi:hypothetical protein